MTNRYKPNEAACPVPLELLALLLRSEEERVAVTVATLPMAQRAALATFCFSRCHMRDLGIQVASLCDEPALRAYAGTAGEALFDYSRNPMTFDTDPTPIHKRKVTLARVAA